MSNLKNKTSFCHCNFDNPTHRIKLIEILNHYMSDPMGDCIPLNDEESQKLILGLSKHTSSFVIFVKVDTEYAGLATCFINFSTFKAMPYINLHDIIILQQYRGIGIGRKLLEKIIEIAKERDYCKITLEVREDNHNAKKLYSDLGFKDTEPMMHFWTKTI